MDGHERLARPDLGEWTGGRAMSIPDHARTNFNTLLRTASDGNLALMECADAVTGETRYVICTVGRDGGDFVMTPFGHQIGRAHVCTPVTNAHLVCRLLIAKKNCKPTITLHRALDKHKRKS